MSKILEICVCNGSGGGAPEASECIKRLVEKSMETSKFFENFHKLWENFLFSEANLKNKASLMVYWKSLVTLKEIKKQRQIFVRLG